MLIFIAQFFRGGGRRCIIAVKMKWYTLFHMCALIISDCNNEKMVKIGQQKLKKLQRLSLFWNRVYFSSAVFWGSVNS